MTHAHTFAALVTAASLILSVPAAAQAPAPSAEQNRQWQDALAEFYMAAVWLRRCPTERVFRQRAAENTERILSEFFHANGMTETIHRAAKEQGRQAAIGTCTDGVRAERAGKTSARAFLMLTAGTPDLAVVAELFLLTGSIDDSPCGVARGRAFAARPDQTQIRREIERARVQAGADADEAVRLGDQIRVHYAQQQMCEKKQGWTPIILSGWGEMYTLIQNPESQVETQEYGGPNSWIWEVEAQRGNSRGRTGGVHFACRTHTPWLDEMLAHYDCDLSVDPTGRTLAAKVLPNRGCASNKCATQITQVQLQLFASAQASAPTLTFTGRNDGSGNYVFSDAALRALTDPNQTATLAQVIVAGVTRENRTFTDGYPRRGAPPGFPVHDFQDAYSWAFAPASTSITGR